MSHRPHLSDMTGMLHYEAGDRVISRVSVHLTKEQERRIAVQVSKFCGADINLLILDASMAQLLLVPHDEQPIVLVEYLKPESVISAVAKGELDLDCTRVRMQQGDKLILRVMKNHYTADVVDRVKRWAGNDIEVITTVVNPA